MQALWVQLSLALPATPRCPAALPRPNRCEVYVAVAEERGWGPEVELDWRCGSGRANTDACGYHFQGLPQPPSWKRQIENVRVCGYQGWTRRREGFRE